MRLILSLAALSLLTPPGGTPDLSRDLQRCGVEDSQERITGCTAVIASPQASAETKANSLYKRAVAYNHLHRYDLALADMTAYIAARPDAPEGYSERAYNYARSGRFDLAIADDAKAIKLAPGNAKAFNNRAWDYHLAGDDGKALADANKALDLAPGDAESLETRAEIYERMGQRENAIADYRAALRADPGDPSATDGLKRLGAAP